MFVLIGVTCLVVMCASILIFASFTISQYNKKHYTKMNVEKKTKDYCSLLFDVYDGSAIYNNKVK